MAEARASIDRILAAGDFSSWLEDMQAAIRGERAADVPCGGCTACCTASQFVHIGPDETDTLAHIPVELLFPAPRLPAGHVVLGYDERGHCPMLVDNKCSIYDHRPRTCRTYDCRVFAATGVEVDHAHDLIAQQVRRWKFAFPTATDQADHDAVRSAARYLDERVAPTASESMTPTQRAVRAVETHAGFLACD